MDLQKFLSLQRKQLEQDRQRLSALNNNNSQKSDNKNKGKVAETSSPCPAALLMQTENFVPGQCQRRMANANECNEPHNASTSALATVDQNSELQLELDLALSEPEQDVEEEVEQDGGTKASTSLIKSAKEFVNQRELLVGSARQYKSPNASHRSLESERPQSENRLPIGRHKKAVSRGAHNKVGVANTWQIRCLRLIGGTPKILQAYCCFCIIHSCAKCFTARWSNSTTKRSCQNHNFSCQQIFEVFVPLFRQLVRFSFKNQI